jgi:hypothetical protein
VRIIVFDGFGEEIKSGEREDGQFKFSDRTKGCRYCSIQHFISLKRVG